MNLTKALNTLAMNSIDINTTDMYDYIIDLMYKSVANEIESGNIRSKYIHNASDVLYPNDVDIKQILSTDDKLYLFARYAFIKYGFKVEFCPLFHHTHNFIIYLEE